MKCDLEAFSYTDFSYSVEPIDIEMPEGYFIYATADLGIYNETANPVPEIAAAKCTGTWPEGCDTLYIGKNLPHVCDTCQGTGEIIIENADIEVCPECMGKRIT
jgi:hypothetical protein